MQNLNQKNWLVRFVDRMPDYLTLALIVVCGSLVARLTWLLFPLDPDLVAKAKVQEELANSQQQVQVIQARAPRINEGDEVARYHLFGQVQLASSQEPAPAIPVAATPVVAPKPREPMELVGVYALPGKDGYAFLKIRGQQKIFQIDEAITLRINGQDEAFGATLVKVTDNSATLDWGKNERQVLPLVTKTTKAEGNINNDVPSFDTGLPPEALGVPLPEQGITNFEPAVMPMPDPINMPQPDALKQGELPEQIIPPPVEEAPPPQEQPPQPVSLEQFRQDALTDNSKIADVINAAPVMNAGKMTGFQVTPGKNAALFQQAGLSAGDIVTEVNGTRLDNVSNSMQVLQTLSKASDIRLKVLRGGQEITVERSF